MTKSHSGLAMPGRAPFYRMSRAWKVLVIVTPVLCASVSLLILSGLASWLPAFSIGVVVILGITVGFIMKDPHPTENRSFLFSSRHSFLMIQFGFSFTLLLTIWLVGSDNVTSESFVLAWAACVSFLFLASVASYSIGRVAVCVSQCLILLWVFAGPAIRHYSTYNATGDLDVHLSIVSTILASGHIPSSSYEIWPVWHVGVGCASLASGLSARICAFLFVGGAFSLSFPFVRSLVCNLSAKQEVGAISSVSLLITPLFLSWFGYLAPTTFCFGLFSIIVWSFSKQRNLRMIFVFLLLSFILIVSHHLSALIVFCILTLGVTLSLGRRTESRAAGEMKWHIRNAAVIGAIMLGYWLFIGSQFFQESLAQGVYGLKQIETIAAVSSREPFVDNVVYLSWLRVTLFLLVAYLTISYIRHRAVLGIGHRPSRMFGVLAFLVFVSYAITLYHVSLFESIQLQRWALFGSYFMSIVVGIMTILVIRRTFHRRYLALVVMFLLFLPSLSAAAVSSFGSLPFRENHFGIQPRPYFLDSEVEAGDFAADYCQGSISCDMVFAAYFNLTPLSRNASVSYSIESFYSSDIWLLRVGELDDRGIRYSEAFTIRYLSSDEARAFFAGVNVNCILDSKSVEFLYRVPDSA